MAKPFETLFDSHIQSASSSPGFSAALRRLVPNGLSCRLKDIFPVSSIFFRGGALSDKKETVLVIFNCNKQKESEILYKKLFSQIRFKIKI
ncbi:hypothetical protein BpHYR1_046886 [Brachionus plicatilis]|uniref:Uncharacterized protein n=1 Tax=Brachionus plicatilis TaxID=10195 RepID=A0A3M7PVG6_BRAPC|nr:hypothetical protein BpHYR1_046886 [Brachionus plicatilis]